MAKETKKVNLNASENKKEDGKFKKDPRLFGYKNGQKIEVDANAFMSLLNFAHQIVLKERREEFEMKDTFEETLQARKETISQLGLEATKVIEFISTVHISNVENGIAVHKDVLEQEIAKQASAQTPAPAPSLDEL